jgi:hypothetical protein
MQPNISISNTPSLSVLLRGEPASLQAWTEGWHARRLALCLGTVLAGAGLYGAAMGCWRAPMQALYVAIKFPLIILLTTVGNALLNAMLAPLLGLNISFRQSFLAIFLSFTITSAILGSFSPLVAFLIWNVGPMSADTVSSVGPYSLIMVTHVAVIAFAGIVGNLRLAQLLRQLSGSAKVARRVLLAWLAGNLLLGSQLSWNLRPFIGAPALEVAFFRGQAAFKGNFFEAVFGSLRHLLNLD